VAGNGKGAAEGERAGWSPPGRIEIAGRSPARLAIKYRYHLLSAARARTFLVLGIAFIGAGLLFLVTGIHAATLGCLLSGGVILGATWHYPRQFRNIVISKEKGEISFSDSSVFSNRLPMAVPAGQVKCLTIAAQVMASKPEYMLSITLHPVPQEPFSVVNLTKLLVKSYSSDDVEELARIISGFSDFRVVRQA